MLLSKLLSSTVKVTESAESPRPDYELTYGRMSESGERVSVMSSQTIATVYRAKNIISDDIASMPLHVIQRVNRTITQIEIDPVTRNLAYLLQVNPNMWGWTPFQLKKAAIEWLLFYGNAYIWYPVVGPRQLIILPASRTAPVFDLDGNLWYRHTFTNSTASYIPAVEILHTMINPDETGFIGRGVIAYARDTFGRQLAARKTQSNMFKNGFLPAAYVQTNGELNSEAREKLRTEYERRMSGADNAYRLAVFDSKIAKFEPIDIQLADAQFLESIQATDKDIANFFGLPEHKLNAGKQAYNSNEQQNLEYLQTTLDPFLIAIEEAARVKWIPQRDQSTTYVKFAREAILRMNSEERGRAFSTRIQNGMLNPNEARWLEDRSAYALGDDFYMASNVVKIESESTSEDDDDEDAI